MNALIFACIAAACASLTHFIFRKNAVSHRARPDGYLVYYYLFSFLFSTIFSTVWQCHFKGVIFILGGIIGILNVVLMHFTAKALKVGPSGLTFAFQNAGAVFPGVILFLLFGSEFDFACSYYQMVGMSLVILGLFLGARSETKSYSKKASLIWLKYAVAIFLARIFSLTCMQGRCVMYKHDKLADLLKPFSLTIEDDGWFLPVQFGVSLVIQTCIFFVNSVKLHRKYSQEGDLNGSILKFEKTLKSEAYYGLTGGLANFGCAWMLLLATKYALPFERVILFPIFAVSTILFSTIWSNRLYGERLNLLANGVCFCGIFLGVIE